MREISTNLHEESEVSKLPSLPHVLIRLLQACRDERICFDTITDIINKDVALCAKVIAVANSPVYGHVRHQNNLKHIVLALGLDTIKSIAITASVQQFFSRYSNKKIHFLKQFWRHTLVCATIARSLAKLTSYKYVEEAYIAGLLHDIGKLVLANHAGADYTDLTHGMHPANELLALENENFKIGHDELGAHLLGRWGVTDSICDAVRFHHKSQDEIRDAHQLVKILNNANILSTDHVLENPEYVECVATLFDLSGAMVREIIQQSIQEVVTVASSMNIDIGGGEAANTQDEHKHIELAQEVRDIALSRSSQISVCLDEAGTIYPFIRKSIMILFNVRESLIFKCDQESRRLYPVAGSQLPEQSVINDLVLPLDSVSVLSDAIKTRDIQDTFQQEIPSVVDQQIAGGLKTEGFICIPVIRQDQVMDVLVLGAGSGKCATLNKNRKLLKVFAQDVAGQIAQYENQVRLLDDVVTNSQQFYREKAREIIHETNNPLAVIRNYLQLLAQRLNAADPAQEDIKTIKDEIDRVGTIILRCADETGVEKAATQKAGFAINDLVSEINNIFKSSLYVTHNIKANLNLDNDAGKILAGKNTVKQIITNIIKNAVEAMASGGALDIATRNININGKHFVEIEIRDTGPGMPEEILKNLYLPVTSTKGRDHSGLGLSIVKNLMDSIGGLIACRTNKSGTVFSVQIPGDGNK
jgi:putative nucleotidyltransferase with HDIG domain